MGDWFVCCPRDIPLPALGSPSPAEQVRQCGARVRLRAAADRRLRPHADAASPVPARDARARRHRTDRLVPSGLPQAAVRCRRAVLTRKLTRAHIAGVFRKKKRDTSAWVRRAGTNYMADIGTTIANTCRAEWRTDVGWCCWRSCRCEIKLMPPSPPSCYRTQTRDYLFKECPEWKPQQKILWAEVKKETGRWKDQWKVRDLLADGRCSRAVLDFLSSTEVGRRVPAEAEDGAVSAVSELEMREWLEEQGAGAEEPGVGGEPPLFLPTPDFMLSAGEG